MAQAPAVVIVARHGPRMDAADQQWHLSTPTPYDPPLTYGGWNQCRALGLRIANLLHVREQKLSTPGEGDGVSSTDFATVNSNGKRGANHDGEGRSGGKKRRVVKHKVVIHTSPFLRCLQTSTAIAAGLAQFNPTIETGPVKKSVVEQRSRSPNPLGIASPRLRAAEGGGASPRLGPIFEPKHDLAHEVARRALQEKKRHRRSKLRVDAFLGEWLNPGYFEDITPPPPSAMMIRTAKAEMMQNEAVEVFTPMSTSSGKASGNNSLWSGGAKVQSLDEWSQIQDSLPAPTAVRESRSRASTVGSDASSPVESGRKSPFRPGSALSPLTSTLPKPELSVYNPPTPQYAVSSSNQIPRGYVAHARNACANVDFQWDSSRAPQDWGDGGELGEEWSAMHKRFRRGVSNLVEWYSRHDVDDRGEDALGFDQAERGKGVDHVDHDEGEEEEEELVVVMVTHGAGCNALIGALTGQPVLLDVGMASLTMAVRKHNAPPLILTHGTSPAQSPDPNKRRTTTDPALPAIYDVKLTASTEHLRPGSTASASSFRRDHADLARVRDSLAQYKRNFSSGSGSSIDSDSLSISELPRSTNNTSTLLGSIRRPSAAPFSAPGSTLPSRMNSSYPGEGAASPPLSQGLWTPPAGRTPVLRPQLQGGSMLSSFEQGLQNATTTAQAKTEDTSQDGNGASLPLLDFSTSPSDSRPGTSAGKRTDDSQPDASSIDQALLNNGDTAKLKDDATELEELHPLSPPKSLWGKVDDADGVEAVKSDKVERTSPTLAKRRWTVDERD